MDSSVQPPELPSPPGDDDGPSSPTLPEGPTRIGPSLALGLTAPIIGGVVAAVLFFEKFAAAGDDPAAVLEDTQFVFSVLVLSQLTFLILAFVGGMRSKVEFEMRLGLRPPRIAPWMWPVFMLASHGVNTLTGYALQGVINETPAEMKVIEDALLAGGWYRYAIAAVGILVAPVAEELFYRGFVFRGLRRRWSPALAIVVSAYCFALAHGSPQYQALIFPAGVYLGVIAYRAGSIYPGMLCHFYINLIGLGRLLMTEEQALWLFRPPGVWSIFDYLGVGLLPVAIWLLWNGPNAGDVVATETAEAPQLG